MMDATDGIDLDKLLPQITFTSARQRTLLAAQLGINPDAVLIPCEAPGCTNRVPHGLSYAPYGELRVQGGKHPSCICPHVEQHHGCSWEHGIAALLDCLQNHQKDGRGAVHPSLRAQSGGEG